MELQTAALLLLVLTGLGVLIALLQLAALSWHRRRRRRWPIATAGISILKPLCGADDGLAESLERFATLDYPVYELLLGVKDRSDPAYAVARAVEARWPRHVRVVLQRGAPGLNPKINQLLTLNAAARYDIVLISDSNTRAERDYLHEVAAHFADPEVGLVTHALVGRGERTLGAAMDNLHLTTAIAPGVVSAKLFAGHDIVVGKSMALRREDLRELGGFRAFADVLAEDYFIGRAVGEQLGKRIVIAQSPVTAVASHKTVGEFLSRYRRWSVIHRHAVPLSVYVGVPLLSPMTLALVACTLSPSFWQATLAGVVAKLGIDVATARLVRRMPITCETIAALLLKDLLINYCWAHGLVSNTIDWRGNARVVRKGTRLTLPEESVALAEVA